MMGVVVEGDHAYVAARFTGLQIYPAQCTETTGTEEPMATAPLSGRLDQNHPNPFSQATSIRFSLPAAARGVTLEVFDPMGRLVQVLTSGVLPAGSHEVTWDRRDRMGALVPSGVYFYRLTAGAYKSQRKMVLLPGA
jgi:flagellar hook assembly protein FlgD